MKEFEGCQFLKVDNHCGFPKVICYNGYGKNAKHGNKKWDYKFKFIK